MSKWYFDWVNTSLQHQSEIWARCEDLKVIDPQKMIEIILIDDKYIQCRVKREGLVVSFEEHAS